MIVHQMVGKLVERCIYENSPKLVFMLQKYLDFIQICVVKYLDHLYETIYLLNYINFSNYRYYLKYLDFYREKTRYKIIEWNIIEYVSNSYMYTYMSVLYIHYFRLSFLYSNCPQQLFIQNKNKSFTTIAYNINPIVINQSNLTYVVDSIIQNCEGLTT